LNLLLVLVAVKPLNVTAGEEEEQRSRGVFATGECLQSQVLLQRSYGVFAPGTEM